MSRDWPHRFEGTHKENARTPYKGSKSALSCEGYKTIIKADPTDPFEAEDRDVLGEDADYDIKLVR